MGSYPGSASRYGTFDQGGNAWEWNEAIIQGANSDRGVRGGSWFSTEQSLASQYRKDEYPSSSDDDIGFRVAPEPDRSLLLIAGVLGGLALLLASMGLYGVMSFVVTQRTREIGVRIALGAQSGDVVRLFLKEGLRLTIIGLSVGLAGGVVISRLLAAVLVDLSPLDPLAFGGVSIVLALVALLACWVPARRATRVEPLVALRCE